jgi:uncharacterized membrane protein YdjX (TVP38/TMEM64 family)
VAAILLALILVPFFLLEDPMNGLSAWLVARDRPPAVARIAVALLLAADVMLPVPSSLVNTASGALFGWFEGALIAWLGMTAGSIAAWGFGRSAGRNGLRRLVSQAELARAERLVTRHGDVALVLSRPVPVLAEASSLLAGACGVPFPRFIALSTLANAGISIAYAGVGALSSDAPSFLFAVAGALCIPAIAMLVIRRRRSGDAP